MKLAILNITSGSLSGGYTNYLKNILPHMVSDHRISDMIVSLPSKATYYQLGENLPELSFFTLKSNSLTNNNSSDGLVKVKKFQPDVVFVPTARQFKLYGTPIVNMIRNMEPLSYGNEGNPVSETIRNWFRNREAKKVIRNADRILAVSKFVREFLINKWGISSNRIGTVYHGVDTHKSTTIEKPDPVPESWRGKFLFAAGSIRPARGIEDALTGLNKFTDRSIISGLVIAGEAPPRMDTYYNRLKTLIKRYGLDSKVCWAGNLTTEEMSWCYQNCHAFVMTSRVEACPNTALEALSHGCICISNDMPPMPEIFKNTALYYSSTNDQSLYDKIQSTLSWDLEFRKEIRELTKRRASEFTWHTCVDKTVSEIIKAYDDYHNNN